MRKLKTMRQLRDWINHFKTLVPEDQWEKFLDQDIIFDQVNQDLELSGICGGGLEFGYLAIIQKYDDRWGDEE